MSRFFEEIARLAAQRGIRAEEKEDCLHLEMDGTPLCKVMEDGGVRYRKSDTGTSVRNQMLLDITEETQIDRKSVV